MQVIPKGDVAGGQTAKGRIGKAAAETAGNGPGHDFEERGADRGRGGEDGRAGRKFGVGWRDDVRNRAAGTGARDDAEADSGGPLPQRRRRRGGRVRRIGVLDVAVAKISAASFILKGRELRGCFRSVGHCGSPAASPSRVADADLREGGDSWKKKGMEKEKEKNLLYFELQLYMKINFPAIRIL